MVLADVQFDYGRDKQPNVRTGLEHIRSGHQEQEDAIDDDYHNAAIYRDD